MVCAIMAFNIVVCILLSLTWNPAQEQQIIQPVPKALDPMTKFWRPEVFSETFWNREQQHLDYLYNPNLNSNLSAMREHPDWVNDTASPCDPDTRVKQQISDYNMLPKQFQDFLLYFRCRSSAMLINQPDLCKDSPFLLLVIKSIVPHFERRQAIRETWGQVGAIANRSVATVFILGNTMSIDNFPNLTPLLRREAEIYRDILQWDFRDTFFNLTLKEVLFLKWFSSHCSGVQFLFKGDDDVFVNTPRIIDFMGNLPENQAADLFIGDVITNAGPHRDKKLKYFVPESFYVGGYPPYAGGGGYLYSGKLALRLSNVSDRVVLYPIDDVYTGMCLQKLGLVPEKHDGFRTFDIQNKDRQNPCIHRSLMVVHSRTPQEVKNIWPWIVRPELNCQ